MATNAPSYASPQASGAVRRSQQLADAIKQMQSGRTADSYRTNTGTIANVLSDAVLGYARNNAEQKADAALAADKTRLSDMIRGQFPDQQELASQQLNSPEAFDLTPAGNEQRAQQGKIGNLSALLFEATGDPAAAINAGLGQQRQAIEDKRYADETKYAHGRDARGDFVADRGYQFGVDRAAAQDNQWQQGFNQDADQFGQTMGLNRDQFGETVRHNKASEGIDAARVAATAGPLGKQTPMQQAVDKNWADDLVDWAANGSSNFVKNMSQLEDGITRLKSGEELSGPGTTALVGPLRDWWGQAGKEVQQQIQEVVQTSLKQVLGSQFTAKEGEGIMARTFDPTLEEGVNAARAERLMAQMKIAAEQKNAATAYFNEHGTMQGYSGHIPSIDDFNAAIDSVKSSKEAKGGPGTITAPNGQQFSRDEVAAVRNFMATLPASLQDDNFISQLDAVLSDPAATTPAAPVQPSVQDLVNKYKTR